ncbi:MAG: NAD(P)H-dependent oxidoreductase [Bauldia sp.]|nr:NAD(P)H-dependent oxidoreductase [Bauldia sp.]
MTTVFRLDASIREAGSVTRAIADTLQDALVSSLDDVSILRRDLGLKPLPSTAWAGAAFGPYTPPDLQTPEQRNDVVLANTLANELVSADAYVFAIPLYNFGVSQHFKSWVDIVLTDPRLSSGSPSAIRGRPAQLIVARGGGYGVGTPRHGWDHATAWYRRVLEDIWMLDVELIEAELTLADVTPAMAGLRGLAAENLASAHVAAREHGQRLAGRLNSAAAGVLDFAAA